MKVGKNKKSKKKRREKLEQRRRNRKLKEKVDLADNTAGGTTRKSFNRSYPVHRNVDGVMTGGAIPTIIEPITTTGVSGKTDYGYYEHTDHVIPNAYFEDEIEKAILASIPKGKNVILLEPAPYLKMKQMIYSCGSKEIFGKLIVELEQVGKNIFPVVKDVLIPLQRVAGGAFRTDDLAAKWWYQFQLSPEWLAYCKEHNVKKVPKDAGITKYKPAEDMTYLTERMLGHFHSHGSGAGDKPSNSYLDTEDMEEHRQNKPFWIELIGGSKGFSGRITYEQEDKPTLMAKASVIYKWWDGCEETLEEQSGMLFTTTKKWISNYEKRKAEEKKEEEAKTGEKTEGTVDSKVYKIEEVGKRLAKNNKRIAKLLEGTGGDVLLSRAQEILEKEQVIFYEGRTMMAVSWDDDDPLVIEDGTMFLGSKTSNDVAQILKQVLNPGEKFMVELSTDGSRQIVIHDKVGFSEGWDDILDRLKEISSEDFAVISDVILNLLGCKSELHELWGENTTYAFIYYTLIVSRDDELDELAFHDEMNAKNDEINAIEVYGKQTEQELAFIRLLFPDQYEEIMDKIEQRAIQQELEDYYDDTYYMGHGGN